MDEPSTAVDSDETPEADASFPDEHPTSAPPAIASAATPVPFKKLRREKRAFSFPIIVPFPSSYMPPRPFLGAAGHAAKPRYPFARIRANPSYGRCSIRTRRRDDNWRMHAEPSSRWSPPHASDDSSRRRLRHGRPILATHAGSLSFHSCRLARLRQPYDLHLVLRVTALARRNIHRCGFEDGLGCLFSGGSFMRRRSAATSAWH